MQKHRASLGAAVSWDRNSQGLQRSGFREPWMHAADRLERADHQARTDQQNQRQATWTTVNVLRAKLRSRPALALRPPARSASASRTPPCFRTGITPNANPASDRYAEREQQRRRIDRNLFEPRQPRRAHASTPASRPRRQIRRRDSAHHRQRETLDKHLAGDAAAAGAEAARTANSCARPSVRTSSRFATLAQAISKTIPIVAITTQRLLPMSPSRSSSEQPDIGARAAHPPSSDCSFPWAAETYLAQCRSSARHRRSLAAMVTPGRSRAIAWKL